MQYTSFSFKNKFKKELRHSELTEKKCKAFLGISILLQKASLAADVQMSSLFFPYKAHTTAGKLQAHILLQLGTLGKPLSYHVI